MKKMWEVTMETMKLGWQIKLSISSAIELIYLEK